MSAVVLRNVELNGAVENVRLESGVIAAIGDVSFAGAETITAKGGALVPGLHDHHVHLFAAAARISSVNLSEAQSIDRLAGLLRRAAALRAPQDWIRAFGYDDSAMGLISRDDLDQASIANPIRVQDRTGALWVLNSTALDLVLSGETPDCVERDANGRATGRIWRGDAWLRSRIKSDPPSLHALSRQLAAYGITGVTDTSASNGVEEARLFAEARQNGDLLQNLHLMSGADLLASPDYTIGPIKILPDERDLPEVETIIDKIALARRLRRNAAIHCVTAAELALALAAFESAGTKDGDRIEHGGIIPFGMIETLRTLGLTVVTQPNFISDRGDRYAATLEAHELPDLYRLASLKEAGVKLAAGSDAPYGSFDPWSAIKAATTRRTKNGLALGGAERISAREALSLYLGSADNPAGSARHIAIGAPADLCLLKVPLAEALAAPDASNVAATIVQGKLIYSTF